MPFRKVTTFIVAWYCIKNDFALHTITSWLTLVDYSSFYSHCKSIHNAVLAKNEKCDNNFRHGIVKIFGLVWLVGCNMFQGQKQDCPQKRWREWALWHYHMQDILAIYCSFLPLSSRSLELLSLDLILKVTLNSYQIHVQHLESTPDILAT